MTSVKPEGEYGVVVGMGLTGLSCARFLSAQSKSFCVVDTRTEPPLLKLFQKEFSDAYSELGHIDSGLLAGASEIIVSPGLSLQEPFLVQAKENGISIIGDIELFYCQVQAKHKSTPIVAITGSNAKSTVTTLVYEMAQASGLRVAAGGNLGTPALDLIQEDIELYILELSSFQLELLDQFSADVAVFLNLSEDHLDRYASFKEYGKVKQRIFKNCKTAVYNDCDEETIPDTVFDIKANQALSFTQQAPKKNQFGLIKKDQRVFLARGEKVLLDVSELKLKGTHNHLNSLAALAIGDACGFPMKSMLEALVEFSGLPHRCQFVTEINGATYINDSKGTNVGATLAAIEGLSDFDVKNIILIAGGEAKEADFSPLKEVCEQTVKACVLIGRDGALIESALEQSCEIVYALDLQSAVKAASDLAEAGDTVLLSPACASFDQFENYQQRGNCFVTAVQELEL